MKNYHRHSHRRSGTSGMFHFILAGSLFIWTAAFGDLSKNILLNGSKDSTTDSLYLHSIYEDGGVCYYPWLINKRVATRFTPKQYPCRVDSVRLGVALNNSTTFPTTGPDTVWIWKNTGGLPGTELEHQTFSFSPSLFKYIYILEISFDSPPTINSGDFWVGYAGITDGKDSLSVLSDTTSTLDNTRQAWTDTYDGTWELIDNEYYDWAITVFVTYKEEPNIVVKPDSLWFFSKDTLEPMAIYNNGSNAISVTNITSIQPWITINSPTSFNLLPGDSTEIIVKTSPLGLGDGYHSGNIQISSNDPDQGIYNIPVKLFIGDWWVYDTFHSNLPEDFILSIAIEGNVKWIGLSEIFKGGLVKFDDLHWTVYDTSNSGLPDNSVRVLKIDKEGNKWIGTWYGGMAKFNGVTWTVYDTLNSDIPDNDIQAIEIDNYGNKWVATWGAGLAKFNDTVWTIYNTSNSYIPSNWVKSIAIDSKGNKWIGTAKGLAMFNDTNWSAWGTWNSPLPSDNISAVVIDNEDAKWIGTDAGLAKFKGTSSWTVYNTANAPLPDDYIQSLLIDPNGTVWIGTLSGLAGLNQTCWKVFTTSNSGLTDNMIWALAVDSVGDKWIGTTEGLALYTGKEVGIDEKPKQMNQWPLLTIFPNLFKHSTVISYYLPAKSWLSLKVYDITGRLTKTIENREREAGHHNITFDTKGLTGGIYFIQLSITGTGDLTIAKSHSYEIIQKIILLR